MAGSDDLDLAAAGTRDLADDHPPTPVEVDAVVVDLVDQTAALALAHAGELRLHLNAIPDSSGPAIAAARSQVHQLLVDIASLRNAAELLKREVRRAG